MGYIFSKGFTVWKHTLLRAVKLELHVSFNNNTSYLSTYWSVYVSRHIYNKSKGSVSPSKSLMARKLTGSYPWVYDTKANGRFICNSNCDLETVHRRLSDKHRLHDSSWRIYLLKSLIYYITSMVKKQFLIYIHLYAYLYISMTLAVQPKFYI